MPLPVVAVVGRPNVGKSTLVNRFVGKREAIVEELPGVTRDRKELVADWRGRRFRVVDTGGWLAPGTESDAKDSEALTRQVSKQAERAIDEADVILFVVDVTVGVVEEDANVAAVLRRAAKPVLVVANKVDDERRESDQWAFTSLGLGDPHPVSAIHGRSSGDLLDAVVDRLPPEPEASDAGEREAEGDKIFSIAIVGRPNVGKSTLFNKMVGDERSVVHDMPGTTRDTIDTIVETEDGPVRFVDTAGLRRRSRIDESTEYFSMVRALQAIDTADAALFVIDATEGVTHQDQRLAERVDAAGTSVVVVLNKWDLLDADARKQVLVDVADRLAFLSYAPVLKISALTGRNLKNVMPALRQSEEAYHRRIPTAVLNRVIREAQQAHPAPVVRKKRAKVLYATQGATDPPTITLFASHQLPPTYLRYLERMIRERLDLGPTPMKLRVRRRSE
ncbi:MAG: ribosome biogenesis GTPase Der [Acidimicrobiia bacterium]